MLCPAALLSGRGRAVRAACGVLWRLRIRGIQLSDFVLAAVSRAVSAAADGSARSAAGREAGEERTDLCAASRVDDGGQPAAWMGGLSRGFLRFGMLSALMLSEGGIRREAGSRRAAAFCLYDGRTASGFSGTRPGCASAVLLRPGGVYGRVYRRDAAAWTRRFV